MEMNFPHKSLDQASPVPERKERGAHQALLAHAIARQALSPSARAFAARHMADKGNGGLLSGNIIHNRIALFAGANKRQGDFPQEYPFEKGHFRPDISGMSKQEQMANSKDERVVYLAG